MLRRNYDHGQHGAAVHWIKNTCLQSEELLFFFKKKKRPREILDISDFKMHKNTILKHYNIRSCELDCLTTNGF